MAATACSSWAVCADSAITWVAKSRLRLSSALAFGLKLSRADATSAGNLPFHIDENHRKRRLVLLSRQLRRRSHLLLPAVVDTA